jgi:hypothetical protein
MTTYSIIRFYQNNELTRQVIKTGLSLREAQEHCNNPETSSRTCVLDENLFHTEVNGQWFDGYEKEDN